MENRYSRLKALEDYGHRVDWSILSTKSVVIAGVGGLGSIASEILARVGIGSLHLFDLDIIEAANLNRLIFTEEDIGKQKVHALQDYLRRVNPDVDVTPHFGDIMSFEMEDEFDKIMSTTDIGLMCLDNVPARQYFNVKAVRHKLSYIDAGLLRSGMGGYVHLTIPHETACYQCSGSVKVVSTNDASGEPCTASLPTVVNMVASIQTHHLIKHLLDLGEVPDYLSYNAFTDLFVSTELQRDPNCFVCGDK